MEKVYKSASYILVRSSNSLEILSPLDLSIVRTIDGVECVQSSFTDDIVILKKNDNSYESINLKTGKQEKISL